MQCKALILKDNDEVVCCNMRVGGSFFCRFHSVEHNVMSQKKNELKKMLSSEQEQGRLLFAHRELVVIREVQKRLFNQLPDPKQHEKALQVELQKMESAESLLSQQIATMIDDDPIVVIDDGSGDGGSSEDEEVRPIHSTTRDQGANSAAGGVDSSTNDEDAIKKQIILNRLQIAQEVRAKQEANISIDEATRFITEKDVTHHRIVMVRFLNPFTKKIELWYILRYTDGKGYIYCKMNMFEFDPLLEGTHVAVADKVTQKFNYTPIPPLFTNKEVLPLSPEYDKVLVLAELQDEPNANKPLKLHPSQHNRRKCSVTKSLNVAVNFNEILKHESQHSWLETVHLAAEVADIRESTKILKRMKEDLRSNARKDRGIFDLDRFTDVYIKTLTSLVDPLRIEYLHAQK